jgi:hypothetical protein
VCAQDHLAKEAEAAFRMADYVRAGGVLVADCRTAVKDVTGLCHPRTLPGLLSEEYEALEAGTRYALACSAPFSERHTGATFADWVTPRGADVLARAGVKGMTQSPLLSPRWSAMA